MRINYGQNEDLSGLAGVVSLCVPGGGLWSVEGGGGLLVKMAAGLTHQAKLSLHLHKDVASISLKGRSMK